MKKTRVLYGFFGLAIGLLISFIINGAQSSVDPAKAGVTLWILLVASASILFIEFVPAIIFLRAYCEWKAKGHIIWNAIRSKLLHYFIWMAAGLILGLGIVWARSIDVKGIGIPVWIFLFAALFILMLQLIPAIIIFVSLLGMVTKLIHRDKIHLKQE